MRGRLCKRLVQAQLPRFAIAVSAIRSRATSRRTIADLVVRRGCETDEARGRIGEGFECGDRDGRIERSQCALHEPQVQWADEVAVRVGELEERAVTQPDAIGGPGAVGNGFGREI